jgi:hypothetical protein
VLKKPATKKKTTRRSTPRAAVLPIVTNKISSEELKRALSRSAKRRVKSDLVDHAVPSAILFHGVFPHARLTTKPSISRGSHTLSPFILSLKSTLPSPVELLDQALVPNLRVNLLWRDDAIHPMAPANDLPLDQQIELHLTDGILASRGWSVFTRPFSPTIPTLPALPTLHHEALRYDTPTLPRFSSDAFIPQQLPEDIFSYFDFPEEEEPVEELPETSIPLDLYDLELEEEPQPKKKTWKLPAWQLPAAHSWQRAVASFVCLSFLFVLPLHAMNVVQDLRSTKAHLEATGEEAVSLLSQGAQAALARDVATAGTDFRSAGSRFQSAKQAIDTIGAGTTLLLSVIPRVQSSYESGEALVEVGHELAIAGSRLSDGYAAMEAELAPTPISRLNILEAYLTSTVPHLVAAKTALARVKLETVPQEHRDVLTSVVSALPALISTIEEFESVFGIAKEILGAEGSKRYLIVFQNNTEIRPTGGFIGSFAEVKVHHGVIEHLNVPKGGSYDLQGSLQSNLRAPEPIQLLTAKWEFQDGNWFPDFPTSARQLIQFYRDAGGPSVDGVLAVNATFVSELIGLLGPIDMEAYGRTINEENFIFEAQKIVEYEYDKEENAPKAFIGDLAPLLVERTIEKGSQDFLAVLDFLNAGLSKKDLQLYLEDETLERHIIDQGWGGEMKQTDADYLMIVDTNLGGGKTDGVIKQEVDLQVDVAGDGTITNTLTISRTHFGIQGLLFTGVNNVDYLRVYVPKGSTLLSATGFSIPDQSLFEIPDEDWLIDDDLAYGLLTTTQDPVSATLVSEEHGKAVFGNWVQTKPGTTSTVTLRYTLPFKLESLLENKTIMASLFGLLGIPQTDQYALTIQKQPGVLDRTTQVRVNTPAGFTPLWSSHDLLQTSITNETDVLFAILFESAP